MIGEDEERLARGAAAAAEINLGATAIGTGINAPPATPRRCARQLAELIGVPWSPRRDLVEATQDTGAFMQMSGVLKRVAVKLSQDLQRPAAAVVRAAGRLRRDRAAAAPGGSSIMPGKVNPVIPEVVNQVAFEVIGNDVTVTMAAEAGQLQLNAFEPIILHSILTNVSWLGAGCNTLRVNCVDGIQANIDRLDSMVRTSVGVVTALTPYIGYAAASALAKAALLTGRSVADLVVEAGLMTRERVEFLTSPARLSGMDNATGPVTVVGSDGVAQALLSPTEADSI